MGAKFKDIGKILAKALASKVVLEAGAKSIIESVPKRTRLGKGVKEAEGDATPLPALKPKTKTNRKGLKKRGELTGPGATPAKSGLNARGNLLSNLKAVVTPGKVAVKLQNSTQEEKAKALIAIDPGFTFMNVSRAEVNRMIKAMSEEVNKIIKKIKFDGL